ncbi:uncharacterized transmembrane protein DDB_G0289901 [Drosophila elegans]|uniref:uncharacterized transmembrane protein DDB_G0289901 n=1 Tax=Drosophila elegans TaxID=30023 RepID=UPI0007E6862C|nr:uncharacterized transmembrane protein DDB_G0289901 [Drosophila elegans]
MWRLHLFLLLSSCFLVPHDAKPTKRSTVGFSTTTLASLLLETELSSSSSTSSSTSSTSPKTTTRVTNIGRLASKDLADLLLASMQARGAKLTSIQESTMKSLRSNESKDTKGHNVFLEIGMDVIIDILVGARNNATCSRIIQDIDQSQDRNSLTLTLKSFLALCFFNGIECAKEEVGQVIKNTHTRRREQTKVVEDHQQTEGSGLRTARKVADVKDDRAKVLKFLQARNITELTAILNTLLQVCGASSGEAHKIIRNLREMGPDSVSLLQVNAFSMLSISLLDSLSTIAEGKTSGLCSAAPESWIVRLLAMGVDKPVLMGLMTALDRTMQTSTSAELANAAALNSVNGGDLTNTPSMVGPKTAATAKRETGSGNIENLASDIVFMGNDNALNGLVDAKVPAQVGASVLSTNSGSQGNVLNERPNALVVGSRNEINRAVLAKVPAQVGASVLSNNIGGSSSSSPSGNIENLGSDIVFMGNDNALNGLVDAKVPAQVGASILSTNTGSQGNVLNEKPNVLVVGSGNQLNRAVVAKVPAQVGASVLSTNNGGSSSGSSSSSPSNGSGSTGSTVQGGNSASFMEKLVNLGLPLDQAANVFSILSNQGSSAGGSSSVSSAGSSGGSSNGSNAGTFVGNNANIGPDVDIDGSNNTLNSLVDANIAALANVPALSQIDGSGFSNNLNQQSRLRIKGDNNTVTKVADVNAPVLVALSALSSLTKTGGLPGGSSGSSGSSSSPLSGLGGLTGGLPLVGASPLSGLGGLTGGLPLVGSGSSGLVDSLTHSVPIVGDATKSGSGGSGLLAPVGGLLQTVVTVVPPVLNTVLGTVGGLVGGLTGSPSGGSGSPLGAVTNILGGSSSSGGGGGIGNNAVSGPETSVVGNDNNVVKLVDVNGNVLALIPLLSVVTQILGLGGLTGNSLNRGPKTVVIGDNNRIVKLINVDLWVLAFLDVLNIIRGSGGVCNQVNTGPGTEIIGNNNDIVQVVDVDLSVLLLVDLLSHLITTVANDCSGNTTTTTAQPPTVQPPTVQPPTVQPPTVQPPTVQPPTVQPPTVQPPTVQPPTVQPPTDQPPTYGPPTNEPPTNQPPTNQPPTNQPPTNRPPTNEPPTNGPPTVQPPTNRPPSPSPNNCYRRYCRKWRTRPSYLCYKNCGGAFTYKP